MDNCHIDEHQVKYEKVHLKDFQSVIFLVIWGHIPFTVVPGGHFHISHCQTISIGICYTPPPLSAHFYFHSQNPGVHFSPTMHCNASPCPVVVFEDKFWISKF